MPALATVIPGVGQFSADVGGSTLPVAHAFKKP